MAKRLKNKIQSLKNKEIDLELQRALLDEIDEELCLLLAERQEITLRIGVHKAKHKKQAEDKNREAEQNERIKTLANRYHLDENYLINVLNVIRTYTKQLHKQIAKDE